MKNPNVGKVRQTMLSTPVMKTMAMTTTVVIVNHITQSRKKAINLAMAVAKIENERN